MHIVCGHLCDSETEKRRGNIVREEAGAGLSDSSFRFMSLTSRQCQAQPAVPFRSSPTSTSCWVFFFSVTESHDQMETSFRLSAGGKLDVKKSTSSGF